MAGQTAEEPKADGWPDHYPVQLLLEVKAKDTKGTLLEFERGYLFHRKDVEQISVNAKKLKRCEGDRDTCETKLAEETAVPGFWDSTLGDVTKIALGVAGGVGLTLGVLYAAGAGP